MAFAPDYARSGRFYVYFTDRDGDTRVQEFRRSSGSPNRADVATPATGAGRWRTRIRTTTAACCCSGRTGCSTSEWATAAPAATRRTARRTSNRCSARSCASIRAPTVRAPTASPQLEPVRGPRRSRRDLYVRAAQPLALLVRPPQRGPLHRGRRAGPVRGDRLRPARGRPWAQLRLELLRGPAPLRRLTQLSRSDTSRSCSTGAAAGSARSRAASSCATRGCPRWPAATCTATTASGGFAASGPRRARDRRSRARRCASTSSARSVRTPAAGCT